MNDEMRLREILEYLENRRRRGFLRRWGKFDLNKKLFLEEKYPKILEEIEQDAWLPIKPTESQLREQLLNQINKSKKSTDFMQRGCHEL